MGPLRIHCQQIHRTRPPFALTFSSRGWGAVAVTTWKTRFHAAPPLVQDLFLLFPEPSKSASSPRGTGQRLLASASASALLPDRWGCTAVSDMGAPHTAAHGEAGPTHAWCSATPTPVALLLPVRTRPLSAEGHLGRPGGVVVAEGWAMALGQAGGSSTARGHGRRNPWKTGRPSPGQRRCDDGEVFPGGGGAGDSVFCARSLLTLHGRGAS